jgi:hypothetical protein
MNAARATLGDFSQSKCADRRAGKNRTLEDY